MVIIYVTRFNRMGVWSPQSAPVGARRRSRHPTPAAPTPTINVLCFVAFHGEMFRVFYYLLLAFRSRADCDKRCEHLIMALWGLRTRGGSGNPDVWAGNDVQLFLVPETAISGDILLNKIRIGALSNLKDKGLFLPLNNIIIYFIYGLWFKSNISRLNTHSLWDERSLIIVILKLYEINVVVCVVARWVNGLIWLMVYWGCECFRASLSL